MSDYSEKNDTPQRSNSAIMTVVLALVLASMLGISTYLFATWDSTVRLTEFFVLKVDGQVPEQGVRVKNGQPYPLLLRVINHEGELRTYYIDVFLDDRKIREVGPIHIRDDESADMTISITPTDVGTSAKVEFKLRAGGTVNTKSDTLRVWLFVIE